MRIELRAENPVRLGKKTKSFVLGGRASIGIQRLGDEETFTASGTQTRVSRGGFYEDTFEARMHWTRAEAEHLVAGLTEMLAAPQPALGEVIPAILKATVTRPRTEPVRVEPLGDGEWLNLMRTGLSHFIVNQAYACTRQHVWKDDLGWQIHSEDDPQCGRCLARVTKRSQGRACVEFIAAVARPKVRK